jgi:1-deoxy-D-xylulose-5-phosphate reductoisomerase
LRGVVILGATGSIGSSVLDVVARHPDRYRVVAVTAGSGVRALADVCARVNPDLAVIADPSLGEALRSELQARGLATRALAGPEALVDAATCDAHTVMTAIVGAAGLVPTLAAARAGRRVLLANKESIVCSGSLLLHAAREHGAELLPVDSEHSAIHQCLAGAVDRGRDVRRLILTASGGPFRTRADLSEVTPEQAVAHPNWVMGRKISVDSATLMNKGLEVIEASALFGFPADRIDVVVHPQSVIHSMVEFGDGSVVAQLGTPDMRTPIAYALAWPERIASGSEPLDFRRLGSLTFEAADPVRFPCLPLAYRALREGTAACATLNAANEVAVEAFLDRRLRFAAIAGVIEETLARTARGPIGSIDDVLDLDRRSRECARRLVDTAEQATHT